MTCSAFSDEEGLKKAIIKSPLVGILCCSCLCHAMVLCGYHKINVGDRLYYLKDTTRYWIEIQAGDPLIGKTYWIFKNSWGTGSG